MQKVDAISPEEGLAAAKAWLADVDVGEAMHHRNLTVFPLFKGENSGKIGDRHVPRAHPPEPVTDLP